MIYCGGNSDDLPTTITIDHIMPSTLLFVFATRARVLKVMRLVRLSFVTLLLVLSGRVSMATEAQPLTSSPDTKSGEELISYLLINSVLPLTRIVPRLPDPKTAPFIS